MGLVSSPVALTRADLDWVADLSAARRQRLVPFAPRFWNPAPDAREAHARFLGRQIDSPKVLSVRTGAGFLFGFPQAGTTIVDDMVMADEDAWPDQGLALLRHAGQGRRLRFVCPVPEQRRAETARAAGLGLAESWWHRDIEPTARAGGDADLSVGGAEGKLVPAPAVYAPGGPVLLVTRLPDAAGLAAIERAAAARGATVCVVSVRPGQPSALLEDAGYRRTTDYYGGG
jgi:hypothetical protein